MSISDKVVIGASNVNIFKIRVNFGRNLRVSAFTRRVSPRRITSKQVCPFLCLADKKKRAWAKLVSPCTLLTLYRSPVEKPGYRRTNVFYNVLFFSLLLTVTRLVNLTEVKNDE